MAAEDYYASRRNSFAAGVLAVALAIAPVVALIRLWRISSPLVHIVLATILGVVAGGFAGLSVWLFVNSCRPRRLLAITEDGLSLGSTRSRLGQIPWNSIRGVGVRVDPFRNPYLVVFLVDDDVLLNRVGNLRRLILRANREIVESPVAISLLSLGEGGQDLLSRLETQIASARKSGTARRWPSV